MTAAIALQQPFPLSSLRGDEKPFGEATAIDMVDVKKVRVLITFQKNPQNPAHPKTFQAYVFDPDAASDYQKFRGCGYAFISLVRNRKDGTFGDETNPVIPAWSAKYYYGPRTAGRTRVNQIFIENIASSQNKHYKGIGSALMQAVMEYGYAKKCGGRIALSALSKATGFYDKLHLQTAGGSYRYLSEEGIREWKEKIQAHPISAKTLSFLQ
jgi:GNAT superfamily N-acetyltransferase